MVEFQVFTLYWKHVPYKPCISLIWVLYFISIFLDWRLGFEPAFQLKGWNLINPSEWDSYEGFNLEHRWGVSKFFGASHVQFYRSGVNNVLWACELSFVKCIHVSHVIQACLLSTLTNRNMSHDQLHISIFPTTTRSYYANINQFNMVLLSKRESLIQCLVMVMVMDMVTECDINKQILCRLEAHALRCNLTRIIQSSWCNLWHHIFFFLIKWVL